MCPFGSTLLAYALADVKSGMYREEEVRDAILDLEQWSDTLAKDWPWRTTAERMALALATAANAVLGRSQRPRKLEEVIEAAKTTELDTWVHKAEREMVNSGVNSRSNELTGLRERANMVKEMALLLERYLSARLEPQLKADLDRIAAANSFGEIYFDFAQKECALKGHGLTGVVRAVGIVVGQIPLEEVVFG